MSVRPGGTIEDASQNAELARPSGTQTTIIAHIPSSELLGNYQASLRDGSDSHKDLDPFGLVLLRE